MHRCCLIVQKSRKKRLDSFQNKTIKAQKTVAKKDNNNNNKTKLGTEKFTKIKKKNIKKKLKKTSKAKN